MASPKLTEQLGYLIARTNRLIEDDLTRRLQANGIAVDQYRVLKSLEEEGPLPMGRLAERVLVEPATLTKIIDRMVREALVFRVPDEKDRHIAEVFGTLELGNVRRVLSDLGS